MSTTERPKGRLQHGSVAAASARDAPARQAGIAEAVLGLQQLLPDAQAMARLRQLLAEAEGAPLHALDDKAVIDSAAALLHQGRIRLERPAALRLRRLVVRPAAPDAGAGRGAATSAAVTPSRLRARPDDDEVTLDWIEIQLLDSDAKPLAGQRYRIKLPDGSVRRGSLDRDGSARIDDIPGGQCEVCFTEIDGREWKPR